MNGLDGWTCTIFRNESTVRSSDMILDAERAISILGRSIGPDGLITYVETKKVASKNPGYCFRCAGYVRRGLSADKKKILFMKPFSSTATDTPRDPSRGGGGLQHMSKPTCRRQECGASLDGCRTFTAQSGEELGRACKVCGAVTTKAACAEPTEAGREGFVRDYVCPRLVYEWERGENGLCSVCETKIVEREKQWADYGYGQGRYMGD